MSRGVRLLACVVPLMVALAACAPARARPGATQLPPTDPTASASTPALSSPGVEPTPGHQDGGLKQPVGVTERVTITVTDP